MSKHRIRLPFGLSFDVRFGGNAVQQLSFPSMTIEGTVTEYQRERLKGYLIRDGDLQNQLLLISNTSTAIHGYKRVLRFPTFKFPKSSRHLIDLSEAAWLRHPNLLTEKVGDIDFADRVRKAKASWPGKFQYQQENSEAGTIGLRPPQIGAVHAALAHFSVHRSPGTIVLPTGTGKTEVMLSVLVASDCDRLLVVVPTDALRTQIAGKFSSLGILRQCKVVDDNAANPIVGILQKRPKSVAEVKEFFGKCNVVVATMAAISGCSTEVQVAMASLFSHLFIDEAHHIGAPSWEKFKTLFEKCRYFNLLLRRFDWTRSRLVNGFFSYTHFVKHRMTDTFDRLNSNQFGNLIRVSAIRQ